MGDWTFRYRKDDYPSGPVAEISPEEAERTLLSQLDDPTVDRVEALWDLARFYSTRDQQDRTMDYLRQVLERLEDPEAKASCVLAMGQTMEQKNDFESAIRFYAEAFALEPTNTRTWYLIHNNIGFCLNTCGRFAEGEVYCRKAIEIDPGRPNAFKNLGIAHHGQGRLDEAARAFVAATRIDAADPRSLKLLERLLDEHPELALEFSDDLANCRAAVKFALQQNEAAAPVPVKGARRAMLLFSVRLRVFVRRLGRILKWCRKKS